MLTNLYAIYDLKAMVYNRPFTQINEQVAMRTASQARFDPNSEVYSNPEDFSLWEIGQYDDQTAQITVYDQKRIICNFHEIPMPTREHAAIESEQ